MSGFDIYVDRILPLDKLTQIVADCFESYDAVQILPRFFNLEGYDQNKLGVQYALILGGEFPFWLDFIYDDGTQHKSEIEMTKAFCAAAQASALISDSTSNPYGWLLVDHLGNIKSVNIDQATHDAGQNALVIAN